jgi:hypothetical protein
MTDNSTPPVVNMTDERLIQEGELAVERYHSSRESARGQIMPMARGLLAARRVYGEDDVRFGAWLDKSPYRTIEKDDRACLIKLGENEVLAVPFIAQTRLVSPRTIWKALCPFIPSIPSSATVLPFPPGGKSGEPLSHHAKEEVRSPEIDQSVPDPAPIAPNQPVSPTTSAETQSSKAVTVPHVPLTRKHAFHGLKRGEQIALVYSDSKTRTTISKCVEQHGGLAIWDMILTAFDAGFLIGTNLQTKKCSLRILFPNAPSQYCSMFDLSKQTDRKQVRDFLLPAAMANREAIIADPGNIEAIIKQHEQQLRAAGDAAKRAQKLEAAKATMKANECEVLLYGRQFWPILDLPHPDFGYTFEQLQHAVWFFREISGIALQANRNDNKSAALAVRHAIKWLNGFVDPKVMSLVTDMSRALQNNHNGLERLPLMPELDRPYDD